MAKFVIVHGLFKHPSHVSVGGAPLKHPHAERIDNGFLGPSGDPTKPHVLELEEKDAERMDPGCTKPKMGRDEKGKLVELGPWAGYCLKPLALHEAEVKASAAAKAEMEKAKAPKEPAKPEGGAK